MLPSSRTLNAPCASPPAGTTPLCGGWTQERAKSRGYWARGGTWLAAAARGGAPGLDAPSREHAGEGGDQPRPGRGPRPVPDRGHEHAAVLRGGAAAGVEPPRDPARELPDVSLPAAVDPRLRARRGGTGGLAAGALRPARPGRYAARGSDGLRRPLRTDGVPRRAGVGGGRSDPDRGAVRRRATGDAEAPRSVNPVGAARAVGLLEEPEVEDLEQARAAPADGIAVEE